MTNPNYREMAVAEADRTIGVTYALLDIAAAIRETKPEPIEIEPTVKVNPEAVAEIMTQAGREKRAAEIRRQVEDRHG